jgi:hypothetical protein
MRVGVRGIWWRRFKGAHIRGDCGSELKDLLIAYDKGHLRAANPNPVLQYVGEVAGFENGVAIGEEVGRRGCC